MGLGYCLIAYAATRKGISKLEVNEQHLRDELNQNWEVLAEPIQTVMRRYGIEKPYEKLKELTRGKRVDEKAMREFIEKLAIPADEKARLQQLTPATYIGAAIELVENFNKEKGSFSCPKKSKCGQKHFRFLTALFSFFSYLLHHSRLINSNRALIIHPIKIKV